jgi:hypothetical protein
VGLLDMGWDVRGWGVRCDDVDWATNSFRSIDENYSRCACVRACLYV